MTAVLLPNGKQQYFTTAGLPAVGYKVATFDAGTSNPRTTWADALKIGANTNPVILDARGEASIFWEGTYKVQLQDSTGAVIWTQDNLQSQPNSFAGSILPAVTNSVDLGSVTLSWRNVYVGPNNAPVLDTVSGNIGYIARTAVEIAAGVTPTNFWYPEGDLRRYGGDPLGVADASVAWQQAINVGIARIPKGCSFKIVTPATKTGQVTILGEGPTSKLLCDSTVLTLTSGTNSVIDNFWMENLTAPYVITRNPASWGSVIATAIQSNTILGYQPTINDPEYPTLFGLYGSALAATISPTITTTGNASDVLISRIYGRFVYLNLKDLTNSMVCDCDFRGGRGPVSAGSGGGGGPLGCIVFDNVTDGLQTGNNNRAFRNTVRYASFSAITMVGNFDGIMQDNVCCLNGESGLKVNQGNTFSSKRMQMVGNICNQNYYDGIDADASVPASDAQATYHVICNNRFYNNGGDGLNLDGNYNICSGNQAYLNYRFGLWLFCSFSVISGNVCIGNNTVNGASNADILGGVQGNKISGNFVLFTASAGFPIYAVQTGVAHQIVDNYTQGGANFFGNAGSIVPVVEDNLDANSGAWTTQNFTLQIANSAGTLQATFSSDAGTVLPGNFGSRVIGGSLSVPIPTGADAATAMAGGGKIGSANNNRYWLNTAAQSNANSYGIVVIGNNSCGTAVTVRYAAASININGVTIVRPYFEFFNATSGAAFPLTTANIGVGTNIQVQFLGKLS